MSKLIPKSYKTFKASDISKRFVTSLCFCDDAFYKWCQSMNMGSLFLISPEEQREVWQNPMWHYEKAKDVACLWTDSLGHLVEDKGAAETIQWCAYERTDFEEWYCVFFFLLGFFPPFLLS